MERLTDNTGLISGAFLRSEYEYDSLINQGPAIDKLCAIEDLMDQYNIPDLPTLETLLKANAEGRVVVLPFSIEKGKLLYDIGEYIDGHSSPLIYETSCEEITIYNSESDFRFTLADMDFKDEESMRERLFESLGDAEKAVTALEEEKSSE